MLKFNLLGAFFVFISANSLLEVYIPECARKILPSGIDYTISNFGYIPYGQSLIGQVILPKGNQNKQLCNIDNEPAQQSSNSKKFMLVKRGNCKFTQKVLNAQKLKVDLVIIYDNNTTTEPQLIMKNDGHGHLISIPSVFISSVDGQNILKALSSCNDKLFLKQHFDVFETEIVDLSLWLNLLQRQSYVLLRDFYKHDYFNVIQEYANVSVKFQSHYGCNLFQCRDKDCIGRKKNHYCIPFEQLKDNQALSGSIILQESLRMYLLFNLLVDNKYETWFKYMDTFDLNLCFELKDVESCSYETMAKIGVSNQLIQKIQKNLTDEMAKISSQKFDKQNIFYWMAFEAIEKNIIFFPEAVINGKNFYGLFKAPDVFEMICNSLLSQPKQCYSFIKNKTTPQVLDKTEDLWLTVLFIILLMTLGFLVALFIYTRLIKKQVNQQMSMEVNKLVENYVTLVEQNSQSKVENK